MQIPKEKIQPEVLPPNSRDRRKLSETARAGIPGDLFHKFSLVLSTSKLEITALSLDVSKGLFGNSSCVEAAPRMVLTWNSSNHSDHPKSLEMWE